MNALQVLCNLVQSEMGLAVDQVYFYNSKIKPVVDDRLYVAVGVVSQKPFGSTRKNFVPSYPGFSEEISINWQATLSIDIVSSTPEALTRKEEVVAALNSTYAQQLQQREGMMIARHSSNFLNLSELDGSAIPYRFRIEVVMQYSTTKTKQIAYYDDFDDAEVLPNP